MICLYAETQLSSLTVMFYTCICVPFLQIKRKAVRIITFLLDPHHQPDPQVTPDWEMDLPVNVFHDLKSSNGGGEDTCAICLTEFDEEDSVNKLPKCGHMFHVECMEKWLDKCQFTCPLCRSSVLRTPSSRCETWNLSPFCMNLMHHHHS